jgi:PAS domain S-box-containing protein
MLYGNLHPICLFWGPDHFYFYNDGYIPILGASKHPWAMGKKGSEVWNEIWEMLLPQIELVMKGEGATWNEDQYLPILGDDGKPRDAFFTYSYSPVYEVDGKINGVLVTCTETTSRVVAEKKLRESQQSLKLALSSAKMGAWEVNLITTKVNLSQEAREIFGFSQLYDSTDAAIDDFIHPDDRLHARNVLRSAVESGKPYDDVYRIVRPDGEVRWINSKGQARYDYDGNPFLLVGLTFDITEKKTSQEALKASELRFRQIGEALPQLVWTARPDGYCDYLSQQWIEYTGIPESDQLGQNWIEKVIHPDDRKRTYDHWMGAVQGKHPYDIEYRIRRFDNTYRWFKVRATPFRNTEGKTTYWFGTCTDIQDSKEAQLNFEKNVDTAPAMLWITEKDGMCSYLSEQWYVNTGQSPETGLGRGWLQAIHPEDSDVAGRVFHDANENQTPFYLEYRLRQKNGDYRWSIDAGNPRYNEAGDFLGFAGTVIDIHDRKIAELHITEALRTRDDFLSIASHELKTPLTTLRLQVDLQKKVLKKDGLITPEKFENFLNLTDKQTSRITRLVDDMLDVSRIRTGNLTFQWEMIDLCELVTDVVHRLSDQFSKSFYAIPEVVKCADATGHWDRMRLEQIVTNLLTNAIKYGERKPITVTVESEDSYITLLVQDRGIGIGDKDQSKIFERFERAVSANDISGLGLGLYITKQIVLSFRGEISVESKVGEGSIFKVRLPKN